MGSRMSRSPSRTLKLTYLGDASQLSKTTKGAANDMTSLGERVKKVGKTLAVGFAAVGAAGLAMGRKLFQAFEEVSTANARVEQVVDSMGNFEGQLEGTTKRIIEQAEATARLTGVDRNLIKESQALLLTFDSVNKTAGEAGGIFDRATDAAVDLAAAGFGSATSNAQSLGRALEDPIRGLTSLTRQGVTFTEEQQELIKSLVESNRTLEAQDVILKAIERQVGGVAEATANGSEKMRQAFGILRDQIALALAPAFERLVEFGLEFVEKVAEWWEANGPGIIKSFKEFAESLKESWTEFKNFVGAVVDALREQGSLDRLRDSIDRVRIAFNRARESFRIFRDNLVGPDTEQRASAFARIIDIQYIRPFERLASVIETALGLLDRLFALADRTREAFATLDRDRLGQLAPGGPGLTPDRSAVPVVPQRGAGVTNNITVQGAIDPEGTARTIERVLNESRLRGGATFV